MLSLFFNERRLRAGWRIALFFVLLMTSSGLVAQLLLSEPSVMGALDPRQLLFIIPLLLASWLMTRFVDRRPFATLGLTMGWHSFKELLLGAVLGMLLITIVFVGLSVLGAVRITGTHFETSFIVLLFGSGFFFLGGAILEELLMRGYLFQTLLEGLGVYPTLVISSVLFSLAHLANPNISQMGLITIALAGVLFAACYLKTRTLWMPIGLHAAWNFFEGHVFSLPVSGLDVQPRLLDVQVAESVMLTGGAFGPEGSLVTAVVFGLATVMLLGTPFIRPEPGMDRLWKLYIWPAKFGGELP